MIDHYPLLISLLFFIVIVWLGGYAVCTLLTLLSSVKSGERFIFAFPMGAAVLGCMAFCADEFAHIPINSEFVYIVSISMAAIGTGLGVKNIRDWWLRLERTPQDESQKEVSEWTWLAWAELVVILMLAIRQILEAWTAPIIFSDSIIHHLPFAKIVYQTHALPEYADPQNYQRLFATSPLVFLHFAMGWLWLQEIYLFAPKLIIIIFGGHLCAIFYRAARQLLGVTPQAALGTVLVLLLPADRLLIDLLGWGTSTDIPNAVWGGAAVYFLLMQWKEKKGRWWLWSGICGAMACWTKAFGFEFVLAFVIACVIEWGICRWTRRPDANAILFSTIKASIVLGLVLAPFLLRNWIQWGNPIYPFFSSIFGGYLIDAWAAMFSASIDLSNPMERLPLDYLRMFARILGYPPIMLTSLFIIHPRFYRHSTFRLTYLVILFQMFILFSYDGGWGVSVGMGDTASYIRYLFPSTLLPGLFVACLLDQKRYPVDRWIIFMMIGVFFIQMARTYHEIVWLDVYTLPSWTDLNSIKALAYERLPLLIVGGFLAAYLLSPWGDVWITRFRIFILCGCCLLFSYTYALARPWTFFTQPFQRQAVDWTAVPVISSYGDWAHRNLPKSAVFLTDEMRFWIVPRPVVFSNSPLLYSVFYQPDASLEDKLRRLAELGVTHLVAWGKDGHPSPYQMAGSITWAFFNESDSDRYFKEIFRGPHVPPNQDSVGFTFAESYVYEIQYPSHLQRVVESPIPRPWLYEYAAAAVLK